MSETRILSLGQCWADHGALSRLATSELGATVLPVDTFEEAWRCLRTGGIALVLVNRILDANGASGLEFLAQLKQDPQAKSIPAMLVSNFDDAQAQAVALGALPGFGKAALRHAPTLARLRAALAAQESEMPLQGKE